MINIPTLRPDLLQSLESDFGSTIASSIWKKIVNNLQWAEKNTPVGTILFFHAEITEADGTPKDLPNSDLFLFCNGQVVNDSDSPLDGQTIPDLRDLFLKGSDTIATVGGQSTINLAHNHSGNTGVTDDRGGFNADIGGTHTQGSPHRHSIDTRWSSSESIIPKYFTVQAYMRYK